MTDRRWISLAIAFHLVAITVAALPAPADLNAPERTTAVPPYRLSTLLTSPLDSLAHGVLALEPQLYALASPLRILTQPYINAGLRQKWNMFANPADVDTYLRVDYLVASGGNARPNEQVQELVFPAAREDQPRWRHQYRDKAVFSSIENYLVRLDRTTDERQADESQSDMKPVARYFGGRFARTLDPQHHLVRVEIWYGTAKNVAPGESPDTATVAARLQQLDGYRRFESHPYTAARWPAVGALERKDDIEWNLLYAEAVGQ